jgi:hypothetical protein
MGKGRIDNDSIDIVVLTGGQGDLCKLGVFVLLAFGNSLCGSGLFFGSARCWHLINVKCLIIN